VNGGKDVNRVNRESTSSSQRDNNKAANNTAAKVAFTELRRGYKNSKTKKCNNQPILRMA
jgi:hypothetical protein